MDKKSKTIIIMGTGPSLRFCDFKADEIWGVNGTYTTPNIMPEKLRDKFWMSKLFMGDTLFAFETGTLNFDIDAMNAFAKKYHCEMYSISRVKLGNHLLGAKRYPYEKVSSYFGSELFTDTVCYMIAYALYTHSYLAENPNGVIRPELDCPLRLRLFGIDMCTIREYQQSKGGVEHWLGVARGMGCEITNSQGSAILSNPYRVPYGFWHRLKWKRKDYDPLGLMSGKSPTSVEADKLEQALRKKENEQGTGTTDQEWGEGNQTGLAIRHSGSRKPI